MSVVQFLPWAPLYEKKFIFNDFLFSINTTWLKKEKITFHHQQGLIWNYEIKINSDIYWKRNEKRLMITNIASNNMKKMILFFLNYILMVICYLLTKIKDQFNKNCCESSIKIWLGMVEPVKK